MTITIPSWILWLLGIPLVIVILILAAFGTVLLYVFKDGIYK